MLPTGIYAQYFSNAKQRGLTTMSDNTRCSLIVCDISIGMDENHIKRELMNRYNQVKNVTRMFRDEVPKTSVRVDFTSPDAAGKILRDGNIVIGGICRRVYAIGKPRMYQQYASNSVSEQDIMNMFEEQKTLLTKLMNSMDEKLNNAIQPR